MTRVLMLAMLLLCGCELTRRPVDPVEPVVVEQAFDRAACSDALARLAERCLKSEARRASMELDGTLTELVRDGAPSDYIARVRVAVPGIGGKPARDLDVSEIAGLRGVR